MRVRARNRLQCETVLVDGFDNRVRIVARIYADSPLGLFTTDDAGMLLESGDGDLFYDHVKSCALYLVLCSLFSTHSCHAHPTRQATKYKVQSSKYYAGV